MTYCVGILLNDGVVLASDSRTNAGIDRVSTFRKMHIFDKPGERFFALLTAGNLSLTQGVMSLIGEWLGNDDPERDLWSVDSMFGAARVVGRAMREMHKIDDNFMMQASVDFSASIILAGQVRGGRLRLFLVYDAGNFIEAQGDTVYFQIGEGNDGKPILDRIVRPDLSLEDAVKCALISFDSTMRSNVSVGPPIDLLVYRRDSLEPAYTNRLESNDPHLHQLKESWGAAIVEAFSKIKFDPIWRDEATGGNSPVREATSKETAP